MPGNLVTVVVPIYNVEKYLDRCLESIVNQTYKNLEILLIDDGSTDSCPKRCEQWHDKDSRIKVIHKQNGGLGMARNTGMENATGEYICFFDSDDYIAPKTIEACLHTIKEENADIIHFGFYIVDHDLNVINTIKAEKKEVYKGTRIREEFISGMISPNPDNGKRIGLWMSIWGAFFSMKLIRETKWQCASEREIISEDVYSLLNLYNYVNCVVVLPDIFYFYCKNASSLTHTYRQDRFAQIKHFYAECLAVCDKYQYSYDIRRRISYPFMDYTIAAMKQISTAKETFSNKRKLLKEIIEDTVLQEIIDKNRNTKLSPAKKILYFTMHHKWVFIIYILLWAKSHKSD